LRRTSRNQGLNNEERREKRKAILDALVRATEDEIPSVGMTGEDGSETDGYYTLTSEEMDALVNGNMEKIEGWVNGLDKHHAARLLRWLIKENW
jgi:hypothetical protein